MPRFRWSAFLLIGLILPGCSKAASWNETGAAAYLDGRLSWWMAWPTAARDHETFCVSCHTAVPYGVARPALRSVLKESEPSAVEQKFLNNVVKRVRLWNEVAPFYPDEQRGVPKTAESRGTESVLNALILVSDAAVSGKLNADTKLALDNLWGQQLKDGSWAWLQFHNAPWEGDSQYYGATLAALAIGMAPEHYRDRPEIQDGLRRLSGYLAREQSSQVLANRVMLLWASTKLPSLLDKAGQQAIVTEMLSKQQEDGGYSLSGLVGNWKRRDNTPLETKSDGYATGLVTYTLRQYGMSASQPAVERAQAWLAANQDKTEGRWLAYSLNKQRDLSSDIGRFMSDAATAYAVLALTAH